MNGKENSIRHLKKTRVYSDMHIDYNRLLLTNEAIADN